MSRIQIRQKFKTAVLGMAIVLGVLASAERGNSTKMRGGALDPASQQHAASAPAQPQAAPVGMEADIHPVVLRVIDLRGLRRCGDEPRST